MIKTLILTWKLALSTLMPMAEPAVVEPCGQSFCCDLGCSTADMGCSGCTSHNGLDTCSGTLLSCEGTSCYTGGFACGNPDDPWTGGCCSR